VIWKNYERKLAFIGWDCTNTGKGQVQWLMLTIPVIQEADIRRILLKTKLSKKLVGSY
jgi:hypothetical protein